MFTTVVHTLVQASCSIAVTAAMHGRVSACMRYASWPIPSMSFLGGCANQLLHACVQLEHEEPQCCSSYSGTDLEGDAVLATTAEGPAAAASPIAPACAAQSGSESKSQGETPVPTL